MCTFKHIKIYFKHINKQKLKYTVSVLDNGNRYIIQLTKTTAVTLAKVGWQFRSDQRIYTRIICVYSCILLVLTDV